MKRLNEVYVPLKITLLTEDEINIDSENLDDNYLVYFLQKNGVLLINYGLLRCEEVILLQFKDIFVVDNEEIIIKSLIRQKRETKGLNITHLKIWWRFFENI